MPIYEYEHEGEACEKGARFEVMHKAGESPLTKCPQCGGLVRRLVSRPNIASPTSDRELRDQGFTKLVKRDDGLYENVTARDGDPKIVDKRDMSPEPEAKKKPKVWDLDD
ncbi:MAG: zinc ribbon domain-containing protein [Candidatus Lernaella stagnicola]|nr:zinc ribbon domain-containing protein [Candidatus Lernaella stagnicola]